MKGGRNRGRRGASTSINERESLNNSGAASLSTGWKEVYYALGVSTSIDRGDER